MKKSQFDDIDHKYYYVHILAHIFFYFLHEIILDSFFSSISNEVKKITDELERIERLTDKHREHLNDYFSMICCNKKRPRFATILAGNPKMQAFRNHEKFPRYVRTYGRIYKKRLFKLWSE
jgi:hypothetical protein